MNKNTKYAEDLVDGIMTAITDLSISEDGEDCVLIVPDIMMALTAVVGIIIHTSPEVKTHGGRRKFCDGFAKDVFASIVSAQTLNNDGHFGDIKTIIVDQFQ